MRNQPKSQLAAPDKKELILNAAIPVFGKSGFKKTAIEDLTDAADISKQGLYFHFSSKEEIFQAAMQEYLDDGLNLVQQELDKPDTALFQRLMGAMDVWFGRHLVTFTLRWFDVIEAGEHLSASQIENRWYSKTICLARSTAAASTESTSSLTPNSAAKAG